MKKKKDNDSREASLEKDTNPLDEMFGLWKGRNISLSKIRKKAWPERTPLSESKTQPISKPK
jgi:hypothetical protein